MTEVVSSLMVEFMLRGLRLRRLRLCVGVCVRVKLLENVLRLSVAVTLELLACELRNRKMWFHFLQVFPLISDRSLSLWHDGKHPLSLARFSVSVMSVANEAKYFRPLSARKNLSVVPRVLKETRR